MRSFNASESEFVDGLARAIYAQRWADRETERGHSLSGLDIIDAAPRTPRWAMRMARRYARELDTFFGLPLAVMLERWQVLWDAYDYSYRDYDAFACGIAACLSAQGAGTGLYDFGIPDRIPSDEFHY